MKKTYVSTIRYVDKKKSIKTAIKTLQDQFPVIVKTIDCVPNSIYLWTNIKKHTLLKDSMEFIDSSIFMLNIPESEFLKKIDIIFSEKESKNLPEKRINIK